MGDAKRVQLKPIDSATANEFVKEHHYSGKVASNSQFHIGVYWNGELEGAMSFGPSLVKAHIVGLVEGTGWNEFLELNRLVFTDRLPRNSESRALGIACRLLKKHAPQVKWIVSFADATQCGDGTIYRASGFVLTAIKKSTELARLPSGEVIHRLTLHSSPTKPRPELGGRSFYDVTGGRYRFDLYLEAAGGEVLPGYQLRYIKFLDESYRERLVPDVIPFSAIDEVGAGMALGERVAIADRRPDSN